MPEPKELDEMKSEMITDLEEDSPDTDTDTDELEDSPDTDTDTDESLEDDDNPDRPLLEKSGLWGKFKTLEAALGSVRSQEDHIQEQQNRQTRLEAAVDELRLRRGAEPPTSDDVAEMFATDPDNAIRQLGYVHGSQLNGLVDNVKNINQRLRHSEFVSALGEFDELKAVARHYRKSNKDPDKGKYPVFDTMLDMYEASGSQGSFVDLMPLLYDAARGRSNKPPVDKVSRRDKQRATTGSRGRRTTSGRPDFDGMKDADLERWIEEQLRG